MMTESERVTWWFRDFDEGGENRSCCILPSNCIYGVVAFQFHLYPCDYICPLFPLLQHLLWNAAVWNRSINATKECNCNSCEWVAFLAYHAFYDEVLVVHSVKWTARICSLCQFSLRVNLCSMTSVFILWYMHWLLIVMECGLLGEDDALMIDVQCALLVIALFLYACGVYSFNLEEYEMEWVVELMMMVMLRRLAAIWWRERVYEWRYEAVSMHVWGRDSVVFVEEELNDENWNERS